MTKPQPTLVKKIALPDSIKTRLQQRNEQMEKLNQQLQSLAQLNQESMTSFLEGQKIPKNTEVKFNQETWSIEIFKKPREEKSEDSK